MTENSELRDFTGLVLGEHFINLGMSGRFYGTTTKRSVRRIVLRGGTHYQVEERRNGKSRVENFAPDAMPAKLKEILETPGAWQIHVTTAIGDTSIRHTRKGRFYVSHSKPLQRDAAAAEPHDRKKEHPLDQFDSLELLRAVGIAGADGNIRASMRGKLDQVNAFLREIGEATRDVEPGAEFFMLDAGCGLAYLTLAAHGWLTDARGLRVRTVGVDRDGEVVGKARLGAQLLAPRNGAAAIEFVHADLADAVLDAAPDLVVSLHACDTATDEALARAVEWGTRRILAAPCCQHELHASLRHDGPMRGVLRHGILRERLGDMLTDTLRAQILRILGYRARIVEFVAPDATDRNLMLRAEAGAGPAAADAVAEYLELRDFWRVTPWLEQRLATRLAGFLP